MILPTMFTQRKIGSFGFVRVMSSKADDLAHGELLEAEEERTRIIEEFAITQQQENAFTFCGKEVVQDAEPFITAKGKHNTEDST